MNQYIGRILTGKQLNQVFKNYTFGKLTNESETRNGFQFKDGLNIDTIQFDPIYDHESGFYFTEINKMCLLLDSGDYPMYYYRKVTVPDDAQVYIEEGQLKADKLILDKRIPIKELDLWEDEEKCLSAVKQNGMGSTIKPSVYNKPL